MLKAQNDITDAKLELRELQRWKSNKKPVEQDLKPEPKTQSRDSQPQLHPKAKAWIDEQDWWEKDKILTAATGVIASELEADGFDPGSDDYYSEVNKRLKAEFPTKFKDEEFEEEPERKPRQTLAGGRRNPASNKVRLTAEDLALAKKFGMSPEEWARGKRDVDDAQSSDGYTPIVFGRK